MSQGMWAVSKDCKRQENSPLKPPKRRETCFRLLNHNKVSEVKSLSHVQLFVAPWTIDYQVPPSMGFSRQEYWSGLPFPAPGDLPNPGIEPQSPALQADALPSEPPGNSQTTILNDINNKNLCMFKPPSFVVVFHKSERKLIQCLSKVKRLESDQTRKRNKRNPNWNISKMVTVCRLPETIHRKS